MMDAFATLSLPRSPSLDEESVRAAYFEKSKAADADHAALNAAYEQLLAPDKRLKHLIELAAPDEVKQWRTVPMREDLIQHFMALGQVRPEAEALIAKRAKSQTALTKALLERQTFALRDQLEQIGFALDERRHALEASLTTIDDWQSLVEAQAHLAYLAKWQAQVRELLLKLM